MKRFLLTQLLEKHKPKLVVVFGAVGRFETRAICASVLSRHTNVFSVNADNFFKELYQKAGGFFGVLGAFISSEPFPFVCIVDAEPNNKTYCYLKDILGLDVAIITATGDVPSFNDIFAGDEKYAKKIMREARDANYILANLDDEAQVTTAEGKDNVHYFGYDEHAEIKAESVHNFIKQPSPGRKGIRKPKGGMRIKVQHDGSIVPFTINNVFGKRNVYGTLCALGVAAYYDINFVSASQDLAKYEPKRNYLKLLPGVKSTSLLAHIKDVTAFSAREAIEVMGDLRVLGDMAPVMVVMSDILTHKKAEAEGLHRTLGELVADYAAKIFLAGERVVFTEEEAIKHGMEKENVDRWDVGLNEMQKAAKAAERELQKGHLVLILGSEETEINKAVEELKQM